MLTTLVFKINIFSLQQIWFTEKNTTTIEVQRVLSISEEIKRNNENTSEKDRVPSLTDPGMALLCPQQQ